MPTEPRTTTAPSPRRWRQLLRGALAAALPHRLFLVRGPADSGRVCLTFDDGPHPEYTPQVLDVLRDHGVPATFFVIGREAERYPELVRRMAAEGHAVGHHSYCHTAPTLTPARQLVEELRRTDHLLTGLLGTPPHLYRPPHGKVTAAKLWGLWRAGQTVVLWNVDPKDSARPRPEDVRAWFREHPLRGGDIVLMHDNGPHAAAVVPDLIRGASAQGLRFTTPLAWAG